jgi:hypothetical protein
MSGNNWTYINADRLMVKGWLSATQGNRMFGSWLTELWSLILYRAGFSREAVQPWHSSVIFNKVPQLHKYQYAHSDEYPVDVYGKSYNSRSATDPLRTTSLTALTADTSELVLYPAVYIGSDVHTMRTAKPVFTELTIDTALLMVHTLYHRGGPSSTAAPRSHTYVQTVASNGEQLYGPYDDTYPDKDSLLQLDSVN